MPKMKTHSGAKKRFKLTKNGKVKRASGKRNHFMMRKSAKTKRKMRQGAYVDATNAKAIKLLMPYK